MCPLALSIALTLTLYHLVNALPPNTFTVPLDPVGHAELFWRPDYQRRLVIMEVHHDTLQRGSKGWFAVGFSDNGDITNADLCVMWTDWKGNIQFQDGWTDANGSLHSDGQQDCNDFHFAQSGNVTKFSFTRQFDTCDKHDYIIEEGTTHVVYSYGSGPLFRLSGTNLASAEHGFQRTQLLKNLAASIRLPNDAWHVEVLADNVKVPNTDTTYWCHVVKLPDLLKEKHHLVRFEAVIQRGNEPLVHHMEVFKCEADADKEIPLYRGPCYAPDRPDETQICKKVIAAWAMGALPFNYPKEAGLPVGGPDFNLYVMLEVHYNNPELRDDWVDSSGVRIHISPTLRKHDAAVIELGLEYIDKMAIPPGQKSFHLSGYCISECTGVSLPSHGITIFGSQLHTHLTGLRVVTRHVRDGVELPYLNHDNHYSTHFQEIRLLKRPVRVLPGDALITTCWYNTTGRPNITVGGFAITDEMCVNYIYYYPKTDLEVCKSSISDQSLFSYFRSMNIWENQPTSSDLGISDNYNAIQWTPMRAHVLNSLYEESTIYMQCNRSSGERFPGDWSRLPVTPVLYPLPKPERHCLWST